MDTQNLTRTLSRPQVYLWRMIIFLVLRFTVGIRVSKEEELKGLDLGEHGMEAYHGFQFFTNV